MKFNPPKNPNYAATVVEIRAINALEGCDNVVGTPVLGYQAIVGKTTQVGDIGVVFTAETQLSEDFASFNNLFRHAEKNNRQDVKGYLEDNRRVKALKFRGHRSDALFLPLESLAFTGVDVSQLKPGDSFDYLEGHEICQKYEVRTKTPGSGSTPQAPKSRVDDIFLPKHIDTVNFFKYSDTLDAETRVTITQKLHGTSIRIGHTKVARKLSWLERIAAWLGVKVVDTEFAMVYGSRNLIKDANNPDQPNFYDHDIWTIKGRELDGLIPEGYVVYGELIGWTPSGEAIQKDFTYGVPKGTSKLYVYRVTHINPRGRVVDLSWEQVKEFCDSLGLLHVPELWTGLMGSFTDEEIAETFLDQKFFVRYPRAVPLAKESPCDEGVVIRAEGLTPKVYKAKSPSFLRFESKMLDKEVLDIEAEDA
jgi:hypothetical protein